MKRAPFRIGVDGLNLALHRGTGVATYSRTLARTVAEMGRAPDLIFGLPVHPRSPRDLRETLFFAELGRDDPADMAAGGSPIKRERLFVAPWARRLIDVPVEGRVHAEAFAERLPCFSRVYSFGSLWSVATRHFKRYRRFLTVTMPDPPEIMHWTYPLPIHLAGAVNIYTIHDLVPLRLPHTSLENKRLHDRLLRSCIRRGARICTVSEASRRDIVDFLGADAGRVVNCYQSIDPVPAIADDELGGRLRALFDLEPQGYFLYFGAIEPKKNVGRLIEAYLASEVATPLVIVGGRAWRSENELRLLGSPGSQSISGASRVRKLDYLPRRMLDVLIAGARGVLFPSLYEGFGLPVVEALARGVPVMTSTGGSLPEITGNAALLVDPYDVGAMAAAIRRLDGDAALRHTLAAMAPIQAERFTPARFKTRLSALYQSLVPEQGVAPAQSVTFGTATA
ncbi:glycosyltransferase family 1 protein [Sphingomonas gei]|uniref:Glycosyltransferase family 1 protein n=1 Tax=Sphingomonas gei TaxID=1395960 RepID=A0A4S1WYP6_9SPHN|nr:glycosyltransferase family 1 protein [Sphingomonas gei]TGX48699.1 glycosyltransferase family 1 protein [Sphingomonas gei]